MCSPLLRDCPAAIRYNILLILIGRCGLALALRFPEIDPVPADQVDRRDQRRDVDHTEEEWDGEQLQAAEPLVLQ